MADRTYLAIDLGASSGRVVAGQFDGARLALGEIHRFENGPVRMNGHLHWDVPRLWSEIVAGLRKAGQELGSAIASVGVDTWGVDYALVAGGEVLLGNPYHYRDARNDGMLEAALERMSREEIFARTGLQFLPFNTLFQLMAERRSPARLLDAADQMLLMPDLFHWLLSGERSNELTNASTTQLFNPRERVWDFDLLDQFDLPQRLFGDICPPGTRLGPLRSDVGEDTGLSGTEVVLPGTHDTASAVLAVPAEGDCSDQPTWCYISSGTWSLMGVEVPTPRISEECLKFNFTNEGGVDDTTRLLKNIAGLWLLQECRRVWNAAGANWDWEALERAAQAAAPLESVIDPDAEDFLAPRDMPTAIREYCQRHGQQPPQEEGAVIRCALDSLALKYRYVLSVLERIVGTRLETIHVVGGGTQNRSLCQATADACGRAVVAGPVEATATGNLMMQAIASDDVSNSVEARDVIRRSFPTNVYEPRTSERWDAAYERFVDLVEAGD